MSGELISRGDVLRRVLKLMTTHAEDYRPRSYRIWYDYVIGANPSLVSALDAVVAAGRRLGIDACDDLYLRYCRPSTDAVGDSGPGARSVRVPALPDGGSDSAPESRLLEAERVLFGSVEAIQEVIGDVRRHSDRFAGQLADFSEGLGRSETMPTLEDCIRLMTRETMTARDEISEMQSRLAESEGRVLRLGEELARVRSEINVDPLSGLANRRHFDSVLEQTFSRGDAASVPATLLLIDIDGFKSINDQHGHAVGDAAIRAVGEAIRAAVRSQDLPARFGGDEFAVVLSDGDRRAGSAVGEYVRRVVERTRVAGADGRPVEGLSVSVGVAVRKAEDTAARLFERADRALYRAKQNGRNCIETLD